MGCGNSYNQGCKALQRVVRLVEHISGSALPSLQDIYLKRCKSRADKIIKDSNHPGNRLFTLLPFGKRFRSMMAKTERLMALFHCMVRHGTVQYGSLLGGFPLGTVPGTWYFFSTTSVEVPSSRTVTKTWRVNSADHWMAGENRHYCVTELATRDPPLPPYPLDLNQHSQRRIGRNFCLNKRTFLHQPQNSSDVVCWGSSDVPLVDSRGADPVRAW